MRGQSHVVMDDDLDGARDRRSTAGWSSAFEPYRLSWALSSR